MQKRQPGSSASSPRTSKAVAARTERNYERIAAADPTSASQEGCFVWTTATSAAMHREIGELLAEAEALHSAGEQREGFDALLAVSLATSRVHHWYRDTDAPQSCEALARRFEAAWRAALAVDDTQLGTGAAAVRKAALQTIAKLNVEWAKADHLDAFHIAVSTASSAAEAALERNGGGAFGALRTWLLRLVLQTSPSCNVALRSAVGSLLRPLELLSELISLTVGEPFMTLCVPFSAANIEARFARLLMIVFALNLVVCNYCKNSFLLPRPRAGKQHEGAAASFAKETGFGFPSSHSACALAVSVFIVRYSSPAFGAAAAPSTALALTLGWAGSIGAARLLLGVHSIVDVLAGWALGTLCALCFHVMVVNGALDALLAAPYFGVLVVPLVLAISLAHPSPPEASEAQKDGSQKDPSLQESVCVLGCAAGAGLGAWREHTLPWLQPATIGTVTRLHGPMGVGARFVVALFATGVSKGLFKILATKFLPAPAWMRTHTHMILVRLASYVPMAWVLLDTVPALCGTGSATVAMI